jgi:hypothetical protein
MIPILSQFRMPETPFEMFGAVFSALMILAGSAGVLIGLGKMLAKKSAAQVEVGNQPLQIRVLEEVPSRNEFNELKTRVTHIEDSLAPMERRILEGVKDVGRDLTAQIKNLETHEYAARGELWGKLNPLAERVAAEEARSDIGEAIAEGFKQLGKEMADKKG